MQWVTCDSKHHHESQLATYGNTWSGSPTHLGSESWILSRECHYHYFVLWHISILDWCLIHDWCIAKLRTLATKTTVPNAKGFWNMKKYLFQVIFPKRTSGNCSVFWKTGQLSCGCVSTCLDKINPVLQLHKDSNCTHMQKRSSPREASYSPLVFTLGYIFTL